MGCVLLFIFFVADKHSRESFCVCRKLVIFSTTKKNQMGAEVCVCDLERFQVAGAAAGFSFVVFGFGSFFGIGS